MLRLRPYKACDAQVITKWLKDEYAFRQWSADRYENYPITPDDMNLYYDRDKSNEKIWGMTAFDSVKVKKISLGVFENNTAAIKCYESCGFQRVKLERTESYRCMGEIWDCIEMEKCYG